MFKAEESRYKVILGGLFLVAVYLHMDGKQLGNPFVLGLAFWAFYQYKFESWDSSGFALCMMFIFGMMWYASLQDEKSLKSLNRQMARACYQARHPKVVDVCETFNSRWD
jgi:hypothetical protein